MPYQKEGAVRLPGFSSSNDASAVNEGKHRVQPGHFLLFCPLALLALLGSYFGASVASAQIASFPILAHWVARCTSLVVYAAAVPLLCSGHSLLAGHGGRRSAVPIFACACLGAGMAATLYVSASLPVFVAAQVLVGLGQALNLMMWAELLCEAPRGRRWRLVILGGALGCTVSLAFKLLGGAGARVIMVALTAGCCLLPLFARGRKASGGEGPASVLAAARRLVPACFDRVSWGFCLLMGCYALLFRVMGGLDGSVDAGTSLLRFAVTLAGLLAMWSYLSRREGNPDGPNAVVLPLLVLVVTALMAVPAPNETLSGVASAAASSCWPLFYLGIWAILPSTPTPAGANEASVFAVGWFVLNAFLVVLAPLASLLAQQVNQGTLSLLALAFLLIYTIGVASLLARRQDANDRAAAKNELRKDFDAIVASHAAAAGLTPRENDVFSLLARGRSVPFIAEVLSLSPSTVKGHVRHLYAKLGVSNKQELLSLLEEHDDL